LDYALAITFAIFIWWFSTGAVLYLLKMPEQTFGVSMLTATAGAGMGLFGLWATGTDTSVSSAFCGFTCALVVWAWHEMSFLTGYVTGSRVTPCPADCRGRQRFVYATQTLLYHELAIFGTAAFIVALTWGVPNQFGTWTFIILWLARLSAKLNVYLGVPNLTEEFLPRHLEYLKSYFRNRPMNLLFPISVTISTLLTMLCLSYASMPQATSFEATGWMLLSSLMFLVVVEHWFLVLPLPVATLWIWKSDELEPAAAAAAHGSDGLVSSVDESRFEERMHQLARSA
jgi:putative photosynthetic complex assembly protein 2